MSEITVYFATNRDYHNEQGKLVFTNEIRMAGAAEFRAGKAIVKKTQGRYRVEHYELYPERRIRSERKSNRIMRREDLPPEAKIPLARQVALEENLSRDSFGSTQVFEEMREAMRDGNSDAMLMVHGFACTFETAIERAAELKDRYHKPDQPEMLIGVFCWPADGRIFPPTSYFDDRQDAMLSGLALGRMLWRLRDFMHAIVHGDDRCQQRIHLLVHGMGSWVLRYAVQTVANGYMRGGSLPLFENIFLMAADEHADALEKNHKLKPLTRMSKNIHVYHSKYDRALDNSLHIGGTLDRLGSGGPETMTLISSRVTAVDCSRVGDTAAGDGGHQYFRARSEVIDDVLQVLAGCAPDEISNRDMLNNELRRFRIRAQ